MGGLTGAGLVLVGLFLFLWWISGIVIPKRKDHKIPKSAEVFESDRRWYRDHERDWKREKLIIWSIVIVAGLCWLTFYLG